MRIVINAQFDPHHSGGIAQVLIGLAHGLGQLDGEERFLFVCRPETHDLLLPYLGENSQTRINTKTSPAPRSGIRTSDGFWESFDPDVVHFPYQSYTRLDVPTVFNPHDLQHRRFPSYFSPQECQRRDTLYRQACCEASVIATASPSVKDDIVQHYQIAPEKIAVIGWGSPTIAYRRPSQEQVEATLRQFNLQPGFTIYPAQTWPHKNHLKLIEAIAIARDDLGCPIRLVCTGAMTDHFALIEQLVAKKKLGDLVRFTGRVAETELLALYEASQMMVIPSVFEPISFPVIEAGYEEIPLACSNSPDLPALAGDAAVFFNPHVPLEIAQTLVRMYGDASLRQSLTIKGHERARHHSWIETAKKYRALYRSVGAASTKTGCIDRDRRSAAQV